MIYDRQLRFVTVLKFSILVVMACMRWFLHDLVPLLQGVRLRNNTKAIVLPLAVWCLMDMTVSPKQSSDILVFPTLLFDTVLCCYSKLI